MIETKVIYDDESNTISGYIGKYLVIRLMLSYDSTWKVATSAAMPVNLKEAQIYLDVYNAAFRLLGHI